MLIPFEELFHRHGIQSLEALHLGANTGQEAPHYAACGIKRVVWVEALPEVYTQLRANLRAYPTHYAICACLSDKDGDTVEFNVASNEGQSSSILKFGTHSKEYPTVKFTHQVSMVTSRIDTLLAQRNFMFRDGSFLNLDLQGAELLALKGMGVYMTQFDHVYIEVNQKELYVGCPLLKDIDGYLASQGFTRKELKMTNFGWGDAYYQRVCPS